LATGFLRGQNVSDWDYRERAEEDGNSGSFDADPVAPATVNTWRICAERKRLTFVDDFTPFVDRNGDTDELCYAANRGLDFHVGYDASEERMVKIISASIP
jgi:hypothetical protein